MIGRFDGYAYVSHSTFSPLKGVFTSANGEEQEYFACINESGFLLSSMKLSKLSEEGKAIVEAANGKKLEEDKRARKEEERIKKENENQQRRDAKAAVRSAKERKEREAE